MRVEKIKEHIKNVPTYDFEKRPRHLKYKIANWLMEDTLSRTTEWYNELCELIGIDITEINSCAGVGK